MAVPITGLIYPRPINSKIKQAPLFHTRPDFREISASGGRKSWLTRTRQDRLRQSFKATLQAMRRWGHDSPLLSMDALERDRLMQAVWEQGYKAGAGWKRGNS